MKLISWNVNGIRAVHKKGLFLPFVKKTEPDILCAQETKAEETQLPEELVKIPGYFSYFTHSKTKKGYSGVALYTKIEPKEVKFEMGVPHLDTEGRFIEAHFEDFVFLGVYFPNGGGGPERLQYKLDFYDAFLTHIEKLKKEGQKIIFCGDVNTAHEAIDLARPKENEKNTGFLPEERAWIDTVLNHGYFDAFRHLHPNKKEAYTYWDMKTRARDRNVGWRLDYFFASNNIIKKITSAQILSDVYGSDHCPISIELEP